MITCPICIEELPGALCVKICPNGHKLCLACVGKVKPGQECPMCRATIFEIVVPSHRCMKISDEVLASCARLPHITGTLKWSMSRNATRDPFFKHILDALPVIDNIGLSWMGIDAVATTVEMTCGTIMNGAQWKIYNQYFKDGTPSIIKFPREFYASKHNVYAFASLEIALKGDDPDYVSIYESVENEKTFARFCIDHGDIYPLYEIYERIVIKVKNYHVEGIELNEMSKVLNFSEDVLRRVIEHFSKAPNGNYAFLHGARVFHSMYIDDCRQK